MKNTRLYIVYKDKNLRHGAYVTHMEKLAVAHKAIGSRKHVRIAITSKPRSTVFSRFPADARSLDFRRQERSREGEID